MSSKEKLLIIGGSGFIGSHIAIEAVIRGFQVSVISLNNPSLNKKIKNVEYLVSDITKLTELSNVLKDKFFHYVVNLGGYVDHSNFSKGGDKVFDTHFQGAKNIVKCVNSPILKCFIQIGSSDEYGSSPAPQKENQRELPISPYSCAKVSATHFFQMLYRTEGFPALILRPFLVYGIGQDIKRFIPQIIKGCINNELFPVSEGKQLRDFCYIDDFVEAIFLSFYSKRALGEVINIASGVPVEIRSIVLKIQEIIGQGRPKFGTIPYRLGENMALYGDIKKAKKLLKWSPTVNIQEGLNKTVNHYIN